MSQPTELNSEVLDTVRRALSPYVGEGIGATDVAIDVLRELSLAGLIICRIHGGDDPHTGICPTCGCHPVQPD